MTVHTLDLELVGPFPEHRMSWPQWLDTWTAMWLPVGSGTAPQDVILKHLTNESDHGAAERSQSRQVLFQTSNLSDRTRYILELYQLGYGIVRPNEVRQFVNDNPRLASILHDALPQIAIEFPGARCTIEIIVDPEHPTLRQLIVKIATALPPKEAFQRLSSFDERWWLANSARAQDMIVITLAY